jgi:uncharacterized membrane protein YbhN (UPF0104 family)
MKKLKPIIKIIFIIIAFIIIFHKINIEELKHVKFQNPFMLIAAFFLYNVSQFISTLRVHVYLKNIDVTPSFKKQLILYYVGMFYNSLLPGGIGGDAYKAYKFQKAYNQGYKRIIKALLIDRISGLFAIITLCAFIIYFSSFKIFWIYATVLFILSPVLLYAIHKYYFLEFKTSLFRTFLYSLLVQTFQLFTFWAILAALGHFNHIADYSVLFFLSSIVSVIPISVGGIGLRELTFLYGSEMLKMNPTISIVAAFLFFLVSIISSAIGAFFIKGAENV